MSGSQVELVARVTGAETTVGLCSSLRVTAAACDEQPAKMLAVFGAFGKLGAADTFLSGFRPALGVVGALALLASVTALAVTSGPPADSASPNPKKSNNKYQPSKRNDL